MRNASVNSLAFSFSWTWHFTFVSSGQHFSTTPMSKTLFLMFFTSLCLNLSLHDGHLGGREPPTHLRQNVCPHDMVTGSDIRKRHIGHSSRSIFGVRYVTAVSLSSQQRRSKRFLCTPALRGPCKHTATKKTKNKDFLIPARTELLNQRCRRNFPFVFKFLIGVANIIYNLLLEFGTYSVLPIGAINSPDFPVNASRCRAASNSPNRDTNPNPNWVSGHADPPSNCFKRLHRGPTDHKNWVTV